MRFVSYRFPVGSFKMAMMLGVLMMLSNIKVSFFIAQMIEHMTPNQKTVNLNTTKSILVFRSAS